MRGDDWGSDRLPFHASAGGPFEAAGFEEAVSRLLFLAERRWPAGWLVGPSGCGKSVALKSVRRELRRGGRESVLLSLCGVDGDDFWPLVAAAVGGGEVEPGLAARKTVRALLVASSAIDRSVTFLLDDADRGRLGLWDQLAAFVRMAEGVTPGHTVIVATAGELPPGDLGRRLDLRAELRPFDNEETSEYVAHRLRSAGCGTTFAPDAVAELYAATAGVPASVNRIADLSLVAAAASGEVAVTADMIRAATSDLRPCEDEPLVALTAGNRMARFAV